MGEYNFPRPIEVLLTDIRDYLDTNDLDGILKAAEKVLPHRKRLSELQYFEPKTTWGERHHMIGEVMEGRELF